MQLIQQIETLRLEEARKHDYEDMIVYASVTFFMAMTTILLVILSL